MEKSSGIISGSPEPLSFEDHLEAEILHFIRRNYGSTEHAAVDAGVSEKTIRNWRDMGLPNGVKKTLAFIQRHPELSSLFMSVRADT